MVALRNHGGFCCGVSHIYGFPENLGYKDQALRRVKEIIQDFNGRNRVTCQMLEVVLTEGQSKIFHKDLTELGFRLVTRFRNKNSRNLVNVYHYSHPYNLRKWERTDDEVSTS